MILTVSVVHSCFMKGCVKSFSFSSLAPQPSEGLIFRQHLQHGAVTHSLWLRLPWLTKVQMTTGLVKSINISLIIYFCHHQRNSIETPLAADLLSGLTVTGTALSELWDGRCDWLRVHLLITTPWDLSSSSPGNLSCGTKMNIRSELRLNRLPRPLLGTCCCTYMISAV